MIVYYQSFSDQESGISFLMAAEQLGEQGNVQGTVVEY
jgi:hypothetical protein